MTEPKPVDTDNALQIGWLMGKLLEAGLNIDPIRVDGIYTDSVDWRVAHPDGIYRSVRLTITLEEQG